MRLVDPGLQTGPRQTQLFSCLETYKASLLFSLVFKDFLARLFLSSFLQNPQAPSCSVFLLLHLLSPLLIPWHYLHFQCVLPLGPPVPSFSMGCTGQSPLSTNSPHLFSGSLGKDHSKPFLEVILQACSGFAMMSPPGEVSVCAGG